MGRGGTREVLSLLSSPHPLPWLLLFSFPFPLPLLFLLPLLLPLPSPSPSPLLPLQSPAAWTAPEGWCHRLQSQLPLMFCRSAVRGSRKDSSRPALAAMAQEACAPTSLRPAPGVPQPALPCVLSSGWHPAPVHQTPTPEPQAGEEKGPKAKTPSPVSHASGGHTLQQGSGCLLSLQWG